MDWDELVDRYRNTNFVIRTLFIVAAAAVIPAMIYFDQGETLQQDLDATKAAYDTLKMKVDKAERSKTELPQLEQKLAAVEKDLQRARKFLPKSVEFDEILSATGLFEKELGVQVVRFAPGQEVQPNSDIRYSEVPIEIVVKADFGRVMQFFDRLVHMEKLTHLRNISFESAPAEKDPGTVTAKASLVLFRDLG